MVNDALSSQVTECADDIATWMKSNRLQLNSDKTEVLWCATSRRQHQLPSTGMTIDGVHITPVKSVRDLGIYIDADLSMRMRVKKTVSCCFAALRQLRQIRRPPICTYLHIPEAGSCPGAFPAGLWQRRVGGYSCPPNAPTPVGSECSGTTDLQSVTLQPHHRRTRQPSLAASPGTHAV